MGIISSFDPPAVVLLRAGRHRMTGPSERLRMTDKLKMTNKTGTINMDQSFNTLKLKIHGKVQGVSFRVKTRRKAEELGLVGHAENLPDGTVYIMVQGSIANLEKLLNWAKQAEHPAEVTKVEEKWSEESIVYKDFSIKY